MIKVCDQDQPKDISSLIVYEVFGGVVPAYYYSSLVEEAGSKGCGICVAVDRKYDD